MSERTDVLKGTLDLIILNALSGGALHGYGIAKHIRRTTDAVLDVDDGALYPALHRLEDRGWIRARWGKSKKNRRAKYYSLTAKGRKQLGVELSAWERFSEAMHKIIAAGEQPA